MRRSKKTLSPVTLGRGIKAEGSLLNPPQLSTIMAQTKNWAFTLNNYTEEEEEALKNLVPDTVKYLIFQPEVGENGTPHLQGYMQVRKKRTLGGVKKLQGRAHWEPQALEATVDHNIHYCSKPIPGCGCAHCREAGRHPRVGPTVVLGEPTLVAGQRNDLVAFRDAVKSRKRKREIVEDDDLIKTFAKYPRLHATLSSIYLRRDFQTDLEIHWGIPNAGKSTYVRNKYPEAYNLSQPRDGGKGFWWDDYDGEEVVIVEEFHGQMYQDMFCSLINLYPLKVESKGGGMPFMASKVVIVSNMDPMMWWKECTSQTYRRLHNATTRHWVEDYAVRECRREDEARPRLDTIVEETPPDAQEPYEASQSWSF